MLASEDLNGTLETKKCVYKGLRIGVTVYAHE